MNDDSLRVVSSLKSDRSFGALIATQFLGAFNDNLFKMLLMLICADYVLQQDRTSNPYYDPYQTWASLLFALAFLTFSGLAGCLSDRYRKRTIIVASKLAEVVVMGCGLLVYLTCDMGTVSFIAILFVVLFAMGTQSAFFGPAKYGVFPELFRVTDLPAANGIAQATTFLAIILGAALAGPLKSLFEPDLWKISTVCLGIALVGTLTSMFIRSTPAAQPDLRISRSSVFLERKVWQSILADRSLFFALLLYAVFWFVGGVVFLVVTLVGKVQLQIGDTRTSILNAFMGAGIGVGCVMAAALSRHTVRYSLVSIGSCGVCAGMMLSSMVAVLPIPVERRTWLLGAALLISGFFGGWIAVPLQVFIQVRPPADAKGRSIAAMNLITWIGILSASMYYFGSLAITGFSMNPSWILASLGIIMLACSRLMLQPISSGRR